MSASIEHLDERTRNALTAGALYPDVTSIVQNLIQNAIRNSPRSRIILQVDFAPLWQISCTDDGNHDRSEDDQSIQPLSFLGTLSKQKHGEKVTEKDGSIENRDKKDKGNLLVLQHFFVNIPVRRTALKSRANLSTEIRKIKNSLKALSLLCPQIQIICYVREHYADHKMKVVNLEANRDFTDRCRILYDIPGPNNRFDPISIKTGAFRIFGYAGLCSSSSLAHQVILVNGMLVRGHNRYDSCDSILGEKLHHTLQMVSPEKSIKVVYVIVVSAENDLDTIMLEHMAESLRKRLRQANISKETYQILHQNTNDRGQGANEHVFDLRSDFDRIGQINGKMDRTHLVQSVQNVSVGKRSIVASLAARKRKKPELDGFASALTVAPASFSMQVSNLEMIGQVDAKFIACFDSKTNTIILIDQHAAHERIRYEKRLEKYISQCLEKTENDNHTVKIEREINHQSFSKVLYEDLESTLKLLQFWGIEISMDMIQKQKVFLKNMPNQYLVKEENEIQKFFDSLANWLTLDSAHRRLDDLHVAIMKQCSLSTRWIIALRHAPPMINEKLASWSCRGAIMFNDPLSNSQCEKLVSELGQCTFPLQCAHGRPTCLLVSLLDRLPLFMSPISSIDWSRFGLC